MPMLHCYVDDRTMRILQSVHRETGRTVTELAEAAIENEASKVVERDRAPSPSTPHGERRE